MDFSYMRDAQEIDRMWLYWILCERVHFQNRWRINLRKFASRKRRETTTTSCAISIALQKRETMLIFQLTIKTDPREFCSYFVVMWVMPLVHFDRTKPAPAPRFKTFQLSKAKGQPLSNPQFNWVTPSYGPIQWLKKTNVYNPTIVSNT